MEAAHEAIPIGGTPTTLDGQPAAPPLAPGLPRLPGYEILGELGRGGMGVVYKARQTALDRPVALKMLLHEWSATPEQRQRFHAEAQAVARLHHPNVVNVYAVGEYEGVPFLALELVDGGTLADKLAGAPLDPRTAALLVVRLAQAVAAAHQAGIIHRDLKPANVLLTRDGVPKVSDFGLALRLDEARQTQSGAIVGTPAYMAPEQASGQRHLVSPATDVYALGVLLYEMLCGAPPFHGATPAVLVDVIARDPTAPSRLNRNVPRDLDIICLKCLRKEPGSRYASALALADDLGRFLEGRPTSARPMSPAERTWRWCRRNPWLAAAVGTAAAALVAITALSTWIGLIQKQRADEQTDNAARLQEAQGQTAEALQRAEENLGKMRTEEALRREHLRTAAKVSLYHGGKFQDRKGGHGDAPHALLWYARALELSAGADDELATQARQRLMEARGESFPVAAVLPTQATCSACVVSPDGRRIATVEGKMIRLWDAETGASVGAPMTHPETVVALAFSPDGKQLLSAAGKKVRLWHTATGKPDGEAIDYEAPLSHVAFSPDGKALLSTIQYTLSVHDVATRKPLYPPPLGAEFFPRAFIPENFASIASVVALPEGRVALLRKNNFQQGWVELRDAAPSDKPAPRLPSDNAVDAIVGSVDGKYLLGTTRNAAQLWNLTTGKAAQQPWTHPAQVCAIAFSPDGKTAASADVEGRVLLWDVENDKARGPAVRHSSKVTCLAFSPQNDLLLTGCEDGIARLWDVKSGKPVGAPMRHRDPLASVAFAARGECIVTRTQFKTDEAKQADRSDGPVTIWRIGELPYNEIRYATGVYLSPDGRTVAAAGEKHIFVWDAESGAPLGPEIVLPGVVQPKLFTVNQGSPGPRLIFAPDNNTLAAADWSNLVVWHPRRPDQRPLTFGVRDGNIRALSFDATGERLFALTTRDPARITREMLRESRLPRFNLDGDDPNPWDDRPGSPRNGTPFINVSFPEPAFLLQWSVSTGGQPLSRPLALPGKKFWDCGSAGVACYSDDKADADSTATYRYDLATRRFLDAEPLPLPDRRRVYHWHHSLLIGHGGKAPLEMWDAASATWKPVPEPLLTALKTGSASADGRVAADLTPDGKITLLDVATARPMRTLHLLDRYEPRRVILWAQCVSGMELDFRGEVRHLTPQEWTQRRAELERLGGFPLP